MSMSTPGPERVPSSVKVGKTSGQGKPPAGKSAAGNRPGGNRPGGKGKGRKPVTPVKVSGGRNWGPIALGGVVALIVLGIIGWAAFAVIKDKRESSVPWEKRLAKINGVTDYRSKYPDLAQAANHKAGTLTYPVSPPVGGAHNQVWQNCMGDVYTEQIPKENAVHSLEHGSVWVTYKPGLDSAQIDTLKQKVQGKEYMLMSPYPGLDKSISLQAWGFQLKVDSADDKRIDQFIKAARVNTSKEPGATCSGGSSKTGTVPADSPS
jgi:uncharacterized protein DUF3105